MMEDDRSVTVRIPLVFKKHGGRKTVILPDGHAWEPSAPLVDRALLRALARAFRWQRLLDEGMFGPFDDLAKAEGVSQSYVSRVLRLTLLAPDIVEAVLDGRQLQGMRPGGSAGGVSGGVEGAASPSKPAWSENSVPALAVSARLELERAMRIITIFAVFAARALRSAPQAAD